MLAFVITLYIIPAFQTNVNLINMYIKESVFVKSKTLFSEKKESIFKIAYADI